MANLGPTERPGTIGGPLNRGPDATLHERLGLS